MYACVVFVLSRLSLSLAAALLLAPKPGLQREANHLGAFGKKVFGWRADFLWKGGPTREFT